MSGMRVSQQLAKVTSSDSIGRPSHTPSSGCAILGPMDQIEVLREKIALLRSEIADIQALNDRHRFGGKHGAEAQIARVQRQERLQEIQEELIQLSNLSHKALIHRTDETKSPLPAASRKASFIDLGHFATTFSVYRFIANHELSRPTYGWMYDGGLQTRDSDTLVSKTHI